MTPDHGFELHPDAAVDITDIWKFIASGDSGDVTVHTPSHGFEFTRGFAFAYAA